MNKKTKIILIITSILILIVLLINYYKIFIIHNYKISFEVPCDPNIENCFVLECDQDAIDDCTNVPNEYYKLIERKVSGVNVCKENDFDCLACKEEDSECNTVLCDPLVDENICSNF